MIPVTKGWGPGFSLQYHKTNHKEHCAGLPQLLLSPAPLLGLAGGTSHRLTGRVLRGPGPVGLEHSPRAGMAPQNPTLGSPSPTGSHWPHISSTGASPSSCEGHGSLPILQMKRLRSLKEVTSRHWLCLSWGRSGINQALESPGPGKLQRNGGWCPAKHGRGWV